MGKTLVVVESPTKAKTIKKYLGAGYEVMASKGHIKDLPKKMGIDIENGFLETYQPIEGKEKVIAELKAAARNATDLLIATDPDREGEAIAYHIAEELSPDKPAKRVEFHEITKNGVQRGVASPRALNKNLYDAQRARRVLDRIVGYDVSALVWSKLAFGLSAGRVQSVALRLIVDREREIEAFVPVEYWNIGAALSQSKDAGKGSKPTFVAKLTQRNGEKISVTEGETAGRVRSDLETASYKVKKVTKSERKRKAPAPYTTSKLQQDAVGRLGFSAKRTMQVAQGLYEGVELGKEAGQVGLITYMRTDSVRAAPEAIEAAREYIDKEFGKGRIPAQPNVYKSKKSAQEAHEAIRPASLELPPEAVKKYLKDEQYKLYKLIWERFLASQMKDAIYDQTGVDIEAKASGAGAASTYTLRVGGRVLKFAGWLEAIGTTLEKDDGGGKLAGEDEADKSEGTDGGDAAARAAAAASALEENDDATLPELKEGETLFLKSPPGVLAEQKFTQPPPRYNEGSLVRELEDKGIGRPSTYAEIISKVQARDYVEKIDGTRFKPTLLGKFVVDGLVASKLDFMDPAFTSTMESELDGVEEGKEDRAALLGRFYEKFKKQLEPAKKGQRWNPEPEHTGETCSECNVGEMMKRWSKNGWFLGCSNYPKCKNTRDLGPDGLGGAPPKETGIDCDKCGKPMVIRTGRYGEFLSCTGYPACKNARPVPLGVPCPKCGGDLIEVRPKKRGGKTFYGCVNYGNETAKCDFKLWQKPIAEPCPACGAKFVILGGTKAKPMIACADKECGYKRPVDELPPAPPHGPVAAAGAPAAPAE